MNRNDAVPTIMTIGHSTHGIERFLELLRGAGVTAVADVRSVPFSRHTPQFNRAELKASLAEAGIAYVFLGDALGARPQDRGCYRNGVADYDRIAATPAFQAGLDRVMDGAGRYAIALMCAEKEPLDCHRTVLVARRLAERGCRIRHILADGSVEDGRDAERRLVRLMGLDTLDLFRPADDNHDPVAAAYREHGLRIAYVEETESTPPQAPAA